jgi:hypothetical protein
MGCRCNERADAIRDGIKAVAQGDAQGVADAAKFVVVTAAQDVTTTIRDRTVAARARLMQRRR